MIACWHFWVEIFVCTSNSIDGSEFFFFLVLFLIMRGERTTVCWSFNLLVRFKYWYQIYFVYFFKKTVKSKKFICHNFFKKYSTTFWKLNCWWIDVIKEDIFGWVDIREYWMIIGFFLVMNFDLDRFMAWIWRLLFWRLIWFCIMIEECYSII